MSYYHLFVMDGCSFCTEAANVIRENNIEHIITNMDNAASVLKRLKDKTKHDTVPIIFEVTDGESYNFIGGCQELKEKFSNAEKIQEQSREDEEESTQGTEDSGGDTLHSGTNA